MSHIVIIGCGVVGATIAYELSYVPGLKITVLDRQAPAQAATKAALGVLMGVISQKIKGKAWQMRQASIQRYETLIPELEALTGRQIPFNKQGILKLCFSGEDLANWEKLVEIRHSQGWQLEIWDTSKLQSKCPQINNEKISGAIYSPQDRQLDPTALTLALVDAAQSRGVTFKFGVNVEKIEFSPNAETNERLCQKIRTNSDVEAIDWLVLSAGLGSTPLTTELGQIIDIKPVLGQALHLQLQQPLGHLDFQPVITGDDVHIVPVGEKEYWVGATVEFPINEHEILADIASLEKVKQDAIAFCPHLAQATIIRTWSGLRPRPEKRPAPVIGHLPGYSNVLLATGHYRNGVLLAPATAQAILETIRNQNSESTSVE